VPLLSKTSSTLPFNENDTSVSDLAPGEDKALGIKFRYISLFHKEGLAV
jgi:hypothetical protein